MRAGRRTPAGPIAATVARAGALACCLAFHAGCRQDMYDQPRYEPLEASTFFDDGLSARPLVPGTVARGQLRDDDHLFTGKVDGKLAETFPFPVDRRVLERGRERFNIYCSPCHGGVGDGRGMIVARGFPAPPSFHIDRLRTAPPGHFFDVITNGHGAMYPYAARVQPRDRWAIAAYLKALQLSQNASPADVPPEQLRQLEGAAP
jgi:mono/diheme cytochrome c family protein